MKQERSTAELIDDAGTSYTVESQGDYSAQESIELSTIQEFAEETSTPSRFSLAFLLN